MTECDVDEIKRLIKEQNDLLKQNNQTLKDLYAFWAKIVSDEYFDEMISSKGHSLPK